MITINIEASRSYPIHIGASLLDKFTDHLTVFPKCSKICLVSDSTVYPLYGDFLLSTLRRQYEVSTFVFESGEASKCAATYLKLLSFLAQQELTRTDLIIALGGGVVGDLAGFAAATYLRGIPYIQVPTTLLAAVDSSVGGKTAIDLPEGKNLAGAFYQPCFVLCDTLTLRTLPDSVFRDGCAEVIKYAVLYDEELFDHLETRGLSFDREFVISRCVQWKKEAVMADEFDRGLRMKLNLGHTIGHAVESCSQFGISHGKAVSIGMAIVCRSACKHGWLDQSVCQRILNCLEQFGLPVNTEYSSEVLFHAALSDKKRSGSSVNMILPRSIGDCTIVPVPNSELKAFIESGLSV